MPRPQRMEMVAPQALGLQLLEHERGRAGRHAQGSGKARSEVHEHYGPGSSVSSTGLTKPGMEEVFLNDMAARAEMAAKFEALSRYLRWTQQPDVPWNNSERDCQCTQESRRHRRPAQNDVHR